MAWGEIEQEALAQHGSDTRAVTVVLGTGNFKYVTLVTCDSVGAVKSVFAKDEVVYCNITYRNDGTTKDAPIVIVTDIDTNAEVARLGGVVTDIGKTNSMLKVKLGVMPDKDWRLRFDMTP